MDAAICVSSHRDSQTTSSTQLSSATDEMFARCREEFYAIAGRIGFTVRESQLKQLGLVGLICFERMRHAACAQFYPGSTRNQRYRWKRRGLTLAWSHASPELRAFFAQNHAAPQTN